MEIAQYLRGPWLAALILVPVLAGAVVGFVAEPVPSYEARGTFTLVPPIQNQLSADTVDPYVDDFRSALESKLLLDAVDEIAHEADTEISMDPGISAGGNGTDLTVFAASTDAATSEAIVRFVTPYSLDRLADKELERALLNLDAQNLAVRSTRAAIEDFEAANGVQDVDSEFDRRSTDLLSLRNTLASAPTPAQAQQLRALLTEKEAELATYASALTEWRLLDAQHASAVEDQTDAQARFNLVDLWAHDISVVSGTLIVDVEPLSTLPARMMIVVPVALLVAALMFVAAWLSRGRQTAVARHIRAHEMTPVIPGQAQAQVRQTIIVEPAVVFPAAASPARAVTASPPSPAMPRAPVPQVSVPDAYNPPFAAPSPVAPAPIAQTPVAQTLAAAVPVPAAPMVDITPASAGNIGAKVALPVQEVPPLNRLWTADTTAERTVTRPQ
ncbi:MAG: hypothetical protein ACI8Y4_001157 [Candidatus Poriferisodalaceae bacterium]|jgi:hypothetical protein